MTANIETWATATSYAIDDAIVVKGDQPQFEGRFYRALVAHTSVSFATEWGNSYWEEVGRPGPQGPQGDQGPGGAQGIQGPAGANGANGAPGADGIFSAIADQAEAEAGVDNTKGMTPLRTKQAIDSQLAADRAQIATNTADIATNTADIATNAADIAAIVIDSAQITTNKNDIAGHELRITQNEADIAAINVDTAQIATNTADIATINNTTIPGVEADVAALDVRVDTLEAITELARAHGKQRLNNNVGPQDILGSDLPGEAGSGNRWELNNIGARSARAHVEIYRKDDAEERFTTAVVIMQFVESTNTWYIERESTTAIIGDIDGVTLGVTTTNPAPGKYVGTVNYTTNNMTGGNYSQNSYIRFLLQEIRATV